MKLAAFYSEVTGRPVKAGSHENWAGIQFGEIELAFIRVDANYRAPQWPDGEHPKQFHLDFEVDDIEAEQSRVLALGGPCCWTPSAPLLRRAGQHPVRVTGRQRRRLGTTWLPSCTARASSGQSDCATSARTPDTPARAQLTCVRPPPHSGICAGVRYLARPVTEQGRSGAPTGAHVAVAGGRATPSRTPARSRKQPHARHGMTLAAWFIVATADPGHPPRQASMRFMAGRPRRRDPNGSDASSTRALLRRATGSTDTETAAICRTPTAPHDSRHRVRPTGPGLTTVRPAHHTVRHRPERRS